MSIPLDELVLRIDQELFHVAGKGAKFVLNADTEMRYMVSYATGRSRWLAVPAVQQIGRLVFRDLKAHGIHDIDVILEICEDLLQRRVVEYRLIAFQWSFRMKQNFKPSHFPVLARWANSYLTGWGSCDDFCIHTMGYFLYQYPEFSSKVKAWVQSTHPMVRRAAAVSFIYGLRRGQGLEHIFDVADALLEDKDVYVLKGYGWMLKEATKHFQEEVFAYVMRKKDVMPRVSLRYAIEKLPKAMKVLAMAK